MALISMTTANAVKYVSDLDPAKKSHTDFLDPKHPEKGGHIIEDIDWDKATVFHLRPLDVFLMGDIYDNAQRLTGKAGEQEVGIHTQMNKTNIDAVRFGLTGFDNFKDGKGKNNKFETEEVSRSGREYTVATDAMLNLLGIQLIQELAGKIKEISEVSQAEEKNSVSASLQSA